MKSSFQNIWFDRNRGEEALQTKLHLQDRCPDQSHRPQCVTSALLRLALLALQPQFMLLFPLLTTLSPHWPHFRFSNFLALPYSGSFVLLVFHAYSCLGLFFRPQLSFHFLRVVFPDPYLKLLPPSFALCFLPLYQWFSKCV